MTTRVSVKKPPEKLTEQIKKTAKSPAPKFVKPVDITQLISTGSLLLDLAISGGISKYGGIPGRTIIQVYGPNSTGKTTLMAEALGYVQRAGGKYRVRDPEARLNSYYCKTFGVHLNQEEIERTGTITDMFEGLIGPLETNKGVTKRNTDKAWRPDPSKINIYAVDSLAALASKMEMEQGDKMGQKRAKDFSEGFREISDHIYFYNILMFCTDQVRDNVGGYGESQKPSGGNAVGFYASLRIKLKKIKELFKEVKLPGMEKAEKIAYGIEVEAFIKKSSVDRPFRTAPLRLIFNYGYDDIGANLQWLKDHGAMNIHPTDPTKTPGYVIGDRNFVGLNMAIQYVEENNLEQQIRDIVVNVWNMIEEQARPQRKEKVR